MKLSIFTTVTNPTQRGDIAVEALKCYRDLADEVIVVNGTAIIPPMFNKKTVYYPWPQEFEWPFIGEQFQRGYEACTGDWVIHMDIDMLFHQRDFGKIRQALKQYPKAAGVSFYKWQFILPDRYNLKSRLPLAVNKGLYGDRIKFNGGGDLCQPTLDGKELNLNEIPQSGVPFYNYEKLLKTREQIADDQGRMERAWQRHFGRYQMKSDGTNEKALEKWIEAQKGKFQKPHQRVKLTDHPKYMHETLRNLTPEQWGYNGFGELGVEKCFE